jgi:hypothetical protein
MEPLLVSRILASGIARETPRPRDEWSLGVIDGAPAAGVADVILDGDTTATSMPYLVPCADGDRVLTVLLGRSRFLVADLTKPGGIGSALWGPLALAALLEVDGAASGLDADKLDGQEGSYYQAASGYTATDVLAKLLTVDGASSLLDADKLDAQEGSYYAVAANLPVLMCSGQVNLSDSGWTSVSFGVTFAAAPRVTISPETATAGIIAPKVKDVTTTGFYAIIGGSTGFSDIPHNWHAWLKE